VLSRIAVGVGIGARIALLSRIAGIGDLDFVGPTLDVGAPEDDAHDEQEQYR
jgi:hypothetical protein